MDPLLRRAPIAIGRGRRLLQLRQNAATAATAAAAGGNGGGFVRRFAAAAAAGGKCDVVLVGCGVPGRGMGWYHAKQLLDGDIPSGNLTDVVEPWFLGKGANSEAGAEFGKFKEANAGSVNFHASIASVSAPEGSKPKLALISGRTADNPRLLKEVIDAGCTHIFLEKPGAPSVPELEEMAKYAKSKGAGVFMGCE